MGNMVKVVLCGALHGKMGGDFDKVVRDEELENCFCLCLDDDEVVQDEPVGKLTQRENRMFGFFGDEQEHYSFYCAGTMTVFKDERGEFYITEKDADNVY